MKLLITLNDTEETKKFKMNLDIQELKDNLDFIYVAGQDITIRDNEIFVSYIGGNLWIENEDYLLLRIPTNLIHDFIIKETEN